MEPLFRVTTTYNRKTLLESYRNTIKIFGIVMLCVSCAAMLYLAHYFAQYISAYFHNSRVGVLFLAVMTPLILAFYLTTPNRFVRRELKKYRNQFGTKACMIDSVFYTDYFQSKNLNSGALYTIPYSNLGSLRESKNLFYLSPKATNTVYVINKGGFALGSAENFRAFIRSKLDRPEAAELPQTPVTFEALLGKTLLVGLTYYTHDNQFIEQKQYWGKVTAADAQRGIVITRNDGSPFTLPPDLSSTKPAARGEYRLRSTGEVVIDPDFICTWNINRPAE